MGNVLALASALCFGSTHFLSALLSRRMNSTAVALLGQLGGTAAILPVTLAVPAASVDVTALGWGALSGVGTGIGITFLYRGVSTGKLSVVVPVSDVGAVALPVLVGVVLLDERPPVLSWLGIAAAAPALWLVSRASGEPGHRAEPGRSGGTATGSLAGLVAGVGFAVQFIALARADEAAGLWPLLVSRVASVLAIAPAALATRAALRPRPRLLLGTLATGTLGTLGTLLYTLATREQLLTLAVVLTALYPAIPVVLGITALRERVSARQLVGLGLAAVAIALIALSGA
ncbi:EamA family transporter [Goodfellowiella coeruleoviolacea]|uniref:Membrane protein n=1 Tax=Goodfellowiella coeruleoviolacea TaxID=334858 RepID=A0AAE3GEC7_9PSEU|nr:EamA family transporter [Goodfellowiella coeruleoviolacea]MCP2166736.1 putative membrane protein [Goodfellowiella coeruleoviolacea]